MLAAGTYNPDHVLTLMVITLTTVLRASLRDGVLAVNMFMGCMDPLADNYNPYAAYQPDADACISMS